jgi:hypothetical protein
MRNLADAGTSCGEEIAQASGLISLGLNEKILALEMVRVFQGGGKSLILTSIVFQAESFYLEGAIEARADFVGFVILVENGRFFSAFGGLRMKVFLLLADSTDKPESRPDSMRRFPKFTCIVDEVTEGDYNRLILLGGEWREGRCGCIKMNQWCDRATGAASGAAEPV